MLSPEHQAQREGRITSSLAAACLGLDRWKTPLKAWLEITGRSQFAGNRATKRGNKLEDAILDYPAEELDLTRVDAPFVSLEDYPWAGDSCDALYFDGDSLALLGEGKSAAFGMARSYGEEGTDEIPDSVLVQCHWHLVHRPAAPRCVVPVLVGGYDFSFRLYYVDRDLELEGQLLERLARWHRDYVVADKEPPAMAGDTDVLVERHPVARRDVFDPTPEVAGELDALARAKHYAAERVKRAKLAEETAKNRIRSIMGEHGACKLDGVSITYRNSKPRQSVKWEAIARELGATPALIAKHTIEKPGPRSLRVTVKGSDR